MGNIIKIPVPATYDEIKSTIDGFSQVKSQTIINTNGDNKFLQIEFQDTATAQQEEDFKKALANTIITTNDSIKYISEIRKGSILMHNTELQQNLTNLSTSYVDLFPLAMAGQPFGIDFTGFSKMHFLVGWNKNGGTGTHSMRIIRTSDNAVLIEGNMQTGVNPPTPTDFDIPGQFLNTAGIFKIQVKSTVATDDPIFVFLRFYLRA